MSKAAKRFKATEERVQARHFVPARRITEADDEILRAVSNWSDAERLPKFRASLVSFNAVKSGLIAAADGHDELERFANANGLTEMEANAFQIVAAFWEREEKTELAKWKDNRRREKQQRKRERLHTLVQRKAAAQK